MKVEVSFPSTKVDYYFNARFSELESLANGREIVLLTDKNIQALFPSYFQKHPTIIIPSGEVIKSLQTVQDVTEQLIQLNTNRNSLLVGVGGGVITDLTGFVASVYMRGICFGFVPTSLLSMVDAAIGGKNGVNLGFYKNMLGVVRQPEFILYDASFLQTLPTQEWSNGFAEIIKYACVFDITIWNKLSKSNLTFYQNNETDLAALMQSCIQWKNKTVQEDEHEKGFRKLLNFGHTAGHAFENSLNLPHGFAVGLGMLVACNISEKTTGLDVSVNKNLEQVLMNYGLPTKMSFDTASILEILKMDKKRVGNEIDFIVLEEIGKAIIHKVSFEVIHEALINFSHESNH